MGMSDVLLQSYANEPNAKQCREFGGNKMHFSIKNGIPALFKFTVKSTLNVVTKSFSGHSAHHNK